MGYTKVIQSGNLVEIYEYQYDLSPNKSKIRKPRKKSVDEKHQRVSTYRIDNVKRRLKSFARLVRSNLVGDEKPTLITLTMYEIVPVESAYKALTLFIQRLRNRFGKGFKYIAVPEFQERGAVHFHLIFWTSSLLLKQYISDERNTRYIQNIWQYGYVDCLPTDGSHKLAGYLTKYLFKSLSSSWVYSQGMGERPFHGKASSKSYVCSRNVLRPLSLPFKTTLSYTKEIFGVDLSTTPPLQDHKFETQWLGGGRYRVYQI